MKRRSLFIGASCCFAVSVLPPKAIARVRPFCRFSITEGWGDEVDQREFITRRAETNDRSGVPQVVESIKRVLAFTNEIEVYIAQNEDNAFATVAQGRRLLVADVGFLQKLNSMSGTQWGAIQVIAHEVGHHIAGFLADRHRSELNADYWSGQTLQRLGSSKDAATRAILAIGTDFDTASHPNKHRRAETISAGWEDAQNNRIDYSHCEACR